MIALLMAACLQVTGTRVLAADLALAAPEFGALPAGTELAHAPAPGARRVLHTAELARLAARQGLKLERATEVCLEHPTAPLEGEALARAMPLDGARVEVLDFSRLPAPRGRIVFPRQALQRSGLWRGYIEYAAGRRFSIWARVKIAARVERAVAKEDLRPGRPVEAAQVRVESSEGFPDPEAASLEQVVGRALRRRIPAGRPIPLSALAPARDVQRGELVRVEVASSAARLAFTARAESDAAHGQPVRVRNLESGKVFTARAEGKGRVKVTP